MPLPLLPADKANHWVYGSLIGLAARRVLSVVAPQYQREGALLVVALAAAAFARGLA